MYFLFAAKTEKLVNKNKKILWFILMIILTGMCKKGVLPVTLMYIHYASSNKKKT